MFIWGCKLRNAESPIHTSTGTNTDVHSHNETQADTSKKRSKNQVEDRAKWMEYII